MSESDPSGRRDPSHQSPQRQAHPLAELSQRLAEARRAGEPAPEELEQLVGMLAQQNNHPDDRLARALEGLARWSETAKADAYRDDRYPEPPAPNDQPQPAPRVRDERPAPAVSLRSALAEISARQQQLDDPRPAIAPVWTPAPQPQQPSVSRPAPSYAPEPRPQPFYAPPPARSEPPRAFSPFPSDHDPAYAPRPQPAPEPYAPGVEPAPEPYPSHVPQRPEPSQARAIIEPEAPHASPRRVEKIDPTVFVEMRAELERLGRSVGELPSRIQIEGLSRAVSTLTGRLGEQVPASLDVNSLRAIDALVGEVDRMRTEAASPQMVRELGEELKAIAARLEVLGPRNATAIDALARRIEDVRGELQHFPQVSAVDMLGAQINALALRFEAQERAAAPARAAVEGLTGRVAALDDKLDAMAEADRARGDHFVRMNESFRSELENLPRAAAMSALGRQIDALTDGLKSRAAPQPAVTAFRDLTGKFDALDGKLDALAADTGRSDAFAALDRQIQALAATIATRSAEPAPALPNAFAEKVDSLHGRIESIAESTQSRNESVDRVEQAVRSIAKQLSVLPQAGSRPSDATAQLETQVSRLVSGLERNDGRLDDLGAAFAGLAARLEQSCIQLGSDAARVAAEQASRAIAGTGAASDMRGEFAQALSEMRASASMSERRTADTLDAVRLTLDRLLDRIDDRAVAQPPYADAPRAEPEPARMRAPATAPAPSIDATEAARAAARRAMEELSINPPRPSRTRAEAPVHHSYGDLGDDRPLEPGAVRGADPASSPTAASLIAAARRSAVQSPADEEPAPAPRTLRPAAKSSRLTDALAAIKAKKRPLLVGIAAALIVLAALYVASGMTGAEPETAPAVEQQAPRPSSALERSYAPDRERAASADTAWPAPTPKRRQDDPPPAEAAAVDPAPTPAPEIAASPDMAPAPEPGRTAALTPPRTRPTDITSFAYGEATARSAAPARPDWKTAEPLVTGSFNKATAPAAIDLPEPLKARAAQGDMAAQLEVGARLLDGRGVEPNPAGAVRWLEKAAAQGSAPAQHRLGSIYEKGNGVAKDVPAARRWYEQAAASGNVRAMHNLGVIHAEGSLGKPDYNAATVWFRMAADRGLVDSQYNLAILCARGLGGRKDLAEAYKWFSLAAAQGDEDAGRKRDDVAKALGPNLAVAQAALATFRARPIDPAANDPDGASSGPAASR